MYATLSVEYDGKSASVQMTPEAIADEEVAGRMVIARLLPKVGLADDYRY
jgi:hypothetical protein